MATKNREKLAQDVRSPRSAGVAGLVFAFFLILQMVLGSSVGIESPVIRREVLVEFSRLAPLILGTVPFAGIAFLWFTGVIRDWLGEREDRFFSSIFFGSGIVYIAMLFVYAAVLGATLGTYELTEQFALDDDIVIFGFSLVNEVLGNYALRMAGVYMFSIGSLLTHTGHAPRWLIILTFVVATGFLLFAGSAGWARYFFPAWVIIISIYILVVNYRRENAPPAPMED